MPTGSPAPLLPAGSPIARSLLPPRRLAHSLRGAKRVFRCIAAWFSFETSVTGLPGNSLVSSWMYYLYTPLRACLLSGGGNVLCELLAPDEAPLTIPDLDIFPKLQLEQILEEDEEAEAGLRGSRGPAKTVW